MNTSEDALFSTKNQPSWKLKCPFHGVFGIVFKLGCRYKKFIESRQAFLSPTWLLNWFDPVTL